MPQLLRYWQSNSEMVFSFNPLTGKERDVPEVNDYITLKLSVPPLKRGGRCTVEEIHPHRRFSYLVKRADGEKAFVPIEAIEKE